jgi:GTP-binding protein LepA
VIGIDATDAIPCSAKTGMGIDEILEAVIGACRRRKGDPDGAAQGHDHRQLVRQLRRRGDAGARGRRHAAPKGDRIRLMATNAVYPCEQLGVFTPKSVPRDAAAAGEVGFIIAGIKELQAAKVGDTITLEKKLPNNAGPPPRRCPASRRSSRRCSPACIPTEASEYDQLRDALEKLKLNDSSLRYEPEGQPGAGLRLSAAASWACCTWRSCRSGWSASSTRT